MSTLAIFTRDAAPTGSVVLVAAAIHRKVSNESRKILGFHTCRDNDGRRQKTIIAGDNLGTLNQLVFKLALQRVRWRRGNNGG